MTQTQNDGVNAPLDNDIPDEITGLGGSSRRYYNVKDGKFICRGTDDVVIDQTDKLIGRLERFGIESGAYRNGRAYTQLEVDFKTKEGRATVRIDLINPDGEFKPPLPAFGLIRGLVAAKFEVNDLFALSAWSTPPPKDKPARRPYNHVKVYRVDSSNKAIPINTPTTEKDSWEDYASQLKELPGFSARPKRNSGPTHYQGLCEDLAGRGWPTPDDNPKGWLTLLGAFGITVQSVDEIQDDTWGEVRLELKNAPAGTACPPQIAAAPKVTGLFGGAAPAVDPSATAYDPAADE